MYTAAQRNRIKRAIVPSDLDDTTVDAGQGPFPVKTNVQGDVYTVFPKNAEDFLFFTISDKATFKQWLKNFKPTNSADVVNNLKRIYERDINSKDRVVMAQFQIGFSRAGLDFLGETGKVQDPHFDQGPQLKDRPILGDLGVWDPVFAKADKDPLHAVLLVAADSPQTRDINSQIMIEQLKDCTRDLTKVSGKERPDPFRGFEHFGYKDGISQPSLIGLTVTKDTPEVQKRDAGVIVMGYKGDPNFDDPKLPKRPAWTKDGSLMVFRKLEQWVPEFEKYKRESGKKYKEFLPKGYENETLTDKEGAELFGAQIIGRWTSGLPLQNFPIRDNPEAAKRLTKSDLNNFDFSVNGDYSKPTDLRCPFFSHIRKTAPRQLEPYIQKKFIYGSSIVRSGITYGPEVTATELRDGKSSPLSNRKRGLLFVCYQSSIENGFIGQTKFGGNDYFPFIGGSAKKHGQDPIIGSPPVNEPVKDSGAQIVTVRSLKGTEHFEFKADNFAPDTATDPRQPFFVSSRGGENFFVPSVSELQRLASL